MIKPTLINAYSFLKYAHYRIIKQLLCMCLCVGERKIEHRILIFYEMKVPQLHLTATIQSMEFSRPEYWRE